jgi:hypothetical protein
MSIVTLKKKTQTRYNNMSVGSSHGFSLNGTRRSQGWVGQTTLSRSFPRTPMKGNTPRGHGGCCGTYNTAPGIIQSAVTSLNDPTEIKSTVGTMKGMLEEKLKPYRNYITVKPDSTQNSNNLWEYTINLGKTTINTVDNCTNYVKYSGCANFNPYFRGSICSTLTSPLSKYSHIKVSDQITIKSGTTLNCPGINNLTVQKSTSCGVLPGPASSW